VTPRIIHLYIFFQRVGHGAQCGGGAAGRETMGAAAGKGRV